jgi:multicomponent Na+:H+ antiporter subunit F
MIPVDPQRIAEVALWVLSVGVAFAFVRLARGPSLPDRIVALDMITQLFVCGVLLLGIAAHDPYQLRVATVLALINFLGTVAFGLYVHRSELS